MPENNNDNQDKSVDRDFRLDSVLKRLEKLEAEVTQLKNVIYQSKPPVRPVTPQPQPQQQPPSRVAVQPTVPKPQIAMPTIPKTSIESAIGTKWIGRIGMVALVFGIAFFLKHAFDSRWIGETGRIIIGIIIGLICLGIGEYYQKKKSWKIYGQIFSGGGLAILYFSIYAAFAFYHLISQELAFAVLIAITTTGITLSIRYNAISIVVLGILGGFLTPIMLSTGENRPITLFAYILLLDTGIIAVEYFKKWRSLGLASLVCTILMYIAWHEKFYTHDQMGLAFIITTIFFLFYTLYTLLFSSKQGADSTDVYIIVFIAMFYFFTFIVQNDAANNWNFKWFVLGLAVAQILFAWISRLLNRNHILTHSFTGVSVVLTVIAAFVVFEKQWISAALATEMLVFAYLGIRLDKILLRVVAYILSLMVFVRFFIEVSPELGPFDQLTLIVNSRFLICGFIIASYYLMLYLFARKKEMFKLLEIGVAPTALVLSQLFSVILLSVEFYDFYQAPASEQYRAFAEFSNAGQLALSLIWVIYASILTGVGIYRKSSMLRLLGILLIGITVAKVFLFDLSALKTIYRIVSFVILGLMLLIVSYFYNRFKHYIFGEDKHE
ncbi:MAG: DUF2339 domain-containing protein [bacterium]